MRGCSLEAARLTGEQDFDHHYYYRCYDCVARPN